MGGDPGLRCGKGLRHKALGCLHACLTVGGVFAEGAVGPVCARCTSGRGFIDVGVGGCVQPGVELRRSAGAERKERGGSTDFHGAPGTPIPQGRTASCRRVTSPIWEWISSPQWILATDPTPGCLPDV